MSISKKIFILSVVLFHATNSHSQQTNHPGPIVVGDPTAVAGKDIDIISNDTPTIRFEQKGGGYAPYTWDVGGNESNFFIRNQTSTSSGTPVLPFRVMNDAAHNSLVLDGGGVGIGTAEATAALDVVGSLRFRNLQGCNAGIKTDSNGNLGCATEFLTIGAGNSIMFGATLGGTNINIAGTDGDRRMSGVAAGAVSATSTDAVNGSQLHAVASSVASALGGSSSVSVDGTITQPVYSVGGANRTGVASAIGALDTSLTSLQNTVASLTSSGSGSVYIATNLSGPAAQATGANSIAIGSGVIASRAGQIALGASSNTYTLAGVTSDASRAAQSGPLQVVTTDASGNLAARSFQDFFPEFGALNDYSIKSRKEARQGIAAAMAMATAPTPSDVGRTAWATNIGMFKDEVAFGAAFAHRVDLGVISTISGGYSWGGGDSHGFRVGLSGEF